MVLMASPSTFKESLCVDTLLEEGGIIYAALFSAMFNTIDWASAVSELTLSCSSRRRLRDERHLQGESFDLFIDASFDDFSTAESYKSYFDTESSNMASGMDARLQLAGYPASVSFGELTVTERTTDGDHTATEGTVSVPSTETTTDDAGSTTDDAGSTTDNAGSTTGSAVATTTHAHVGSISGAPRRHILFGLSMVEVLLVAF